MFTFTFTSSYDTQFFLIWIIYCWRWSPISPSFSEWSSPKSNFPHEKSIFPHFENLTHAHSKNILCSNNTYCCNSIFVSIWNLLKMSIDDFGENADGENWLFVGKIWLGGTLNSMGEYWWSSPSLWA